MTINPWTPDRYKIKESPEPGVTAAIYDSVDPDQPPICIVRPDPDNPERSLLTDERGQTQSMVHYEANRRLQACLTGLNERFYSVTDEASGRGYLHIHDRLREAIDPNQRKVASAWTESSTANTYRNNFDPREPIKDEHRTRSEISNLRAALNRQPSTNKADAFAARYLREHPYPPTA